MTESYKYWLDVDKPSGVVMLHVVGCRYEADKSDTEFKGLGHLKCDGGSLGFEAPRSRRSARARKTPPLQKNGVPLVHVTPYNPLIAYSANI